jgi:hypothetical protein
LPGTHEVEEEFIIPMQFGTIIEECQVVLEMKTKYDLEKYDHSIKLGMNRSNGQISKVSSHIKGSKQLPSSINITGKPDPPQNTATNVLCLLYRYLNC